MLKIHLCWFSVFPVKQTTFDCFVVGVIENNEKTLSFVMPSTSNATNLPSLLQTWKGEKTLNGFLSLTRNERLEVVRFAFKRGILQRKRKSRSHFTNLYVCSGLTLIAVRSAVWQGQPIPNEQLSACEQLQLNFCRLSQISDSSVVIAIGTRFWRLRLLIPVSRQAVRLSIIAVKSGFWGLALSTIFIT